MMKKVYVQSNGCVPNRLEGKRIGYLFKEKGWVLTNQPEVADIIIANYCGYSGDKIEESRKSVETLNSVRREGSEMILTGCVDKISPKFKSDFPFSRCIEFAEFSKVFRSQVALDNLYVSDNLNDILETTKTGIFNIITSKGCLGNCSYCAIRKARGSLKSKPIDEIEKEFQHGFHLGYRKFILWGDDLGAYGIDQSTSYIELLKRLIEIKEANNYRLFLHRLNPQWMLSRYSELMELLKTQKIHMIYTPIQSGSPRILQLMHRPYNIDGVIKCLKEIKRKLPSILIKTDIMIGFPTETDDDFSMTLEAIREAKFDEVVVFNFGGIQGTRAFEMEKQIPENTKSQRNKLLWDTYPYLRYLLELESGNYRVYDKKEYLKVPILMSAYI